MELRNISHFLAVIEAGTFSAAARRLGLSQQALSSSIAKLEKDFDARLFDRTSGIAEVKLTLFGDTVLRHARRIRLEAERIRSEIELLKTAHSGEVRLGVGAEALAGRLVPEAIEQMRNTVPGTKMVIWEDYSDRMMADLLDGRLDIVAGTIPAAWHLRNDLQLHPLFEMDMRVLARADHPLSGRSGLTIRDLVGFTWLVGERSAGEYEAISHAFIDAGVTPPTDLIWSDSVITGTALLLRNNFLVLAPPDLHATLMDADLIVQLDVAAPTQKLRAYVAHLRERPLSPVAQALVEAILRIAVSHNGSGPPGGKPATSRAPRKGRAKALRASQP